MASTSAAMELKVLINILTQGQGIPGLLNQVKQLQQGLTQLGKVPPVPAPPVPPAKPTRDLADALRDLDSASNKLIGTLKLLAGGFLAFESVRFLKDLADTAARAEVLSTVLHVVGNNAGYSVEQLDKADRKIQSLGITASASRQALTQFLEAGLDLAKAPELAKAAQDAAVILNTNSSDAYSRLVTAVQTSNTQMLRHMGIIVQTDSAMQKYALSIGKTASQLTTLERTQAFLNATLDQTRKIEGSYTAAMGDVGKQLTSLDRLTENLKTSLGNQLLPAYLAIVQELTLFLEHMQLASDAMYGQGEGAKQLGDSVRELAQDFRIVAEFAFEHREALAALAKVWALLYFLILPVIRGILSLSAALEGLEGGGVIGALIEAVGLFAASWILVGVAIASLMVISERFRGAVLGVVNTVRTALLSLSTPFELVFQAAVELVEMFTNPFGSGWKAHWDDWYNYAAARIKSIKDLWDEVKADFNQAFPKVEPKTGPSPQASAQRAQTFEQEAQVLTQILAKTREYNQLQHGNDVEAAQRALKELNDLKTKQKTLTETRKQEQDALKYSDVQRKEEASKLQQRALEIASEKLKAQVEDARKNAAFDPFDVGRAFSLNVGQFTGLLEAYRTAGNEASVTTTELARNFVEMGQQAKTKQELSDLKKALDDLTSKGDMPKEVVDRARTAFGEAAIRVRNATQQENALTYAEHAAHVRDLNKRTEDGLNEELEKTQAANEKKLALDKESYDRGLLSMDDYYDARMDRVIKQNALQRAVAEGQVRTAESEVSLARPQEREAATTRLQEAQANLRKVNAANEKRELDELMARRGEYYALDQKILDIQLQTAASSGLESALVAQIEQKYKDQLTSLHAAGLLHDEAVLRQAQENELAEVHRKARQETYQIEDGIEKALRDQLDLYQRQRSVAASSDKRAVAEGRMTDYEATRRNNDRIGQEMSENRLRRASLERDLANQQARAAQEQFLLNVELSNQTNQNVEVINRLTADQQKYNAQIAATKSNIMALDGAYDDLSVSMQLESRKIRDAITNNLSDALTEMTLNFRNVGEIWKNTAQSIAREIVGTFAKMLTQTAVQKFLKIFAKGASGGSTGGLGTLGEFGPLILAEGGPVSGPGTGTSDSIPAMVSAGEHIMPASKAAQWMPLLEGIRLGKLSPAFALGGVVALQSIAPTSLIPRRYANGGVVISDGGAASVTPGAGGPSHMVVSLHPDAMNMTLREWLEHEVVRQQGRR